MEYAAAADQITVDLIRYEDDIMFAADIVHASQLRVAPNTTGRVVGTAEDAASGVWQSSFSLKVLEIYGVVPLCIDERTIDHLAACCLDDRGEGGVDGAVNEYAVSRLGKSQ